ncbi:MAG: rRNA maturation RNase YbeY [Planctomycetaceae bacterium]
MTNKHELASTDGSSGLGMNPDPEPVSGVANGGGESSWRVDVLDRTGQGPVAPQRLRGVVLEVLRDERVGRAEISVAVVDDEEMARLHLEFLQVEGPTDVLSFPLDGDSLRGWDGPIGERRGEGRSVCGEVVISVDMADRVAREVGCAAADELTLYLVHGVLHLCGYDDLDDADREQMRRRESELLAALGVAARVGR